MALSHRTGRRVAGGRAAPRGRRPGGPPAPDGAWRVAAPLGGSGSPVAHSGCRIGRPASDIGRCRPPGPAGAAVHGAVWVDRTQGDVSGRATAAPASGRAL